MTTRFTSAASMMAKVLGHPDYAFAVLPHPLSSADDAALRVMAEATLADARRLLLRA